MKCLICKVGETKDDLATMTMERGETVIVIREVPA